MLRVRLPWVAVLVTLATAVVLLFGPLWTTSVGENPLDRPSFAKDPQSVEKVLRLALPTVMVLASCAVALAGRARPGLAVAALLLFGYAVWQAPAPLPLWFAPALLLTAGSLVWVLVGERRRATAYPEN